ncbi:MAG: glycosyltransferase family A protein [Thermosynechococcus sp. Uc]|uniref:glycosyltransferase family 2 protein n=1 Tax=Thermosynechococcus sp. Uc TaxID=3034853 RepID=UPI00259F76DD|nr:glycosyltransferase family A protein [Thermosynechococcus sp. Uc]MDM7325709.1 glycosyltransferase family A protein [Thermosynechococcus sp. Uc]
MISVVIPLYNKAAHIGHTLESVLRQTSPAAEVIVVDDGSTDGGAAIVQEFRGRGVRLIQQTNQGVSAARNRGVAEATEPYVAFLDADDEWLPEHLATLQALICDFPTASLWSTFCVIRRNGEYHLPPSPFSNGWRGIVDPFFEAYAKGLSIVNSSTCCVRKEHLLAVGGFPLGVRLNEDYITWCTLALRFPVAHEATVTAIYNQDAENRCGEPHTPFIPASLAFLIELLRSPETPRAHHRGIQACFQRIALTILINAKIQQVPIAMRTLLRLAWQGRCYTTIVLLAFWNALPASFLKQIKAFRHRHQRQLAQFTFSNREGRPSSLPQP